MENRHSDTSYDIEQIIKEAHESKSRDIAADEETRQPVTAAPKVGLPPEEVILLGEEEKTSISASRWGFRRKKQRPAPVETVEVPVIKTASIQTAPPPKKAAPSLDEDADIRIYQPSQKPAMPPRTEPDRDEVKTYTGRETLPEREAATRVLEITGQPEVHPQPLSKEEPAGQELEGQLTFDALNVAELEPPIAVGAQEHEDLEARIRDIRREKVESFQLLTGGKPGTFRLSGEEEENDPAEEPEELVEEELEDYGSYEETEAVHSELIYRRRIGLAGLLFSGFMELILISIAVVVQVSSVFPMSAALYLTSNLFVLALMMLLHHRVIGDGFASLLRLRATADSAAALAVCAAFLHTALQYLNLTEVANGLSPVCGAAAGLGLFCCALGRQYRISRIAKNFRFVSHEGKKYAVQRVEDENEAEQLGRSSVMMGTPEVACAHPANFLSNFLENSYDVDGSDGMLRRYVPLAFCLSLVSAVAYVFLGGELANWWKAISVFTAALCMSMPAFAAVGSNLPLYQTAKRLLRRGAMLTGWHAVEEFSDISGMAVDASDLFPDENILLHGIKTFSGTRIDEAILDAAAVSIQAGGPLSAVFRRVIENRVDMLQEVDTLLYEQEMGLSGWVGGRRVLVGNRRLLENHGVDVPSRDYEMRYTKDNRRLVYLSTGGELSAMFVVSYVADEGIADTLRGLGEAGITLLVRTCDPNITKELICSAFGLDEYYVDILDVSAGRIYEKLTGNTEASLPAVLATNGRLEGMASALSACRWIRPKVARSTVAQIVAGGCGLLLSGFAALYTGFALPPLYQLGFLAVGSAVSLALCLIGKK